MVENGASVPVLVHIHSTNCTLKDFEKIIQISSLSVAYLELWISRALASNTYLLDDVFHRSFIGG